MRKALLGSTALIAGSFVAGPAFAQLELDISGSVDVHAGFVSEDLNDNRREIGITTDTTLNIDTKGVADNGLEYGSRINIDDDGDAFKIDETYVFVSGTFGQLRFGATDPAASELRFAVPAVGNGQADGDFGRYVNPLTNDDFVFGTDFFYSGDDNKLVYLGEFGDFTIGASFSPTDQSVGADPAQTDNDSEIIVNIDPPDTSEISFNPNLENIFSIGANYRTDFNNVGVGISAGVNFADVEPGDDGSAADILIAGLGIDFEDPIDGVGELTEFGTGAEIVFGNVVLGGFFINTELEIDVITIERDQFGVGATFSTGPWNFGANALFAEAEISGLGVETGSIEDTVFGVGVEYALADGLSTYADLVFFEHEALDPAFDNSGEVFLVGMTASF